MSDATLDLVVVGAGPCGIAAGAAAEQAGLSVVLFDKGCVTQSLIGYPWTMSHGAFPPEEKRRKGITESVVRLSIGIEHADDLCADLAQALEQAARAG